MKTAVGPVVLMSVLLHKRAAFITQNVDCENDNNVYLGITYLSVSSNNYIKSQGDYRSKENLITV